MKKLFYLFFLLSLCQGALGQNVTSPDPQRTYRIYLDNQRVELIQTKDGSYRGDILCATSPMNFSSSTTRLTSKSYPIPDFTVKKLMERFKMENIETLPSCYEIEGCGRFITDGTSVKFEVTTNQGQRRYMYSNPEANLMDIQFKEIQNVRAILRTLRSELNPGKVYSEFYIGLPEGTLVSNGKRMWLSDPNRGWSWEDQPEFPDGDTALITFLSKNLKIFEPDRTAPDCMIIFTYFDVEKDGTLSIIQMDGLSENLKPRYEAEISRAVKLMPQWIPGKKSGVIEKMRVTLFINVKLPPNLNKMSEEQRMKAVREIAQKAFLKYGGARYVLCDNPQLNRYSAPASGLIAGETFYSVLFWDKSVKERTKQNSAAEVIVRMNTGEATSIGFVNGEETWGIDITKAEEMESQKLNP